MLSRDEQMQPGFVDFQTFAQGFGFARREAISWAGISIPKKSPPGGISPGL